MELWIAGLVPVGANLVAMRWMGRRTRRAALLFATLVSLFLAPYFLRFQTPVSLDFLYTEAPWAASRPEGYLQKNFLLNDVPLLFLPWREAAVEQIRGGSLPLFNRSVGAGTPLWEKLNAEALFPTRLLGIPFSGFAWPLFAVSVRLLIALWGCWFFLSAFRLGFPARLFGSVAYGFSTYLIAFLMFAQANVAAMLPWALFAIDRLARTNDRRWIGGAAVIVFFLVAAGHPGSIIHGAFLALPWSLERLTRIGSQARVRALGRYAAAGVLGALLAAPLLIPFASYSPMSQRVHDAATLEGFGASPPLSLRNLAPFLVPNYFGNPRVHNYRHEFVFNDLVTQYAGLTTLVLAFSAAIVATRRLRFWIFATLGLVLLAVPPAPFEALYRSLPFFGLSGLSRIRFVLALAIVVLGAHGVDLMHRRRRLVVFRIVAIAVFVFISLLCILSVPVFAEFGIRRLVFFTEIAALAGCLWIVVLAWRTPSRIAFPILLGLLFLDLLAVAPLYNPGNGRKLFYPKTQAIEVLQGGEEPYRITGLDLALIPSTATFYGLEDIRPHDELTYRPYLALLERAGLERSYFNRFRQLPPRPLLDFMGVRWIVTPPDARAADLPLAYRGNDAAVYRNDRSLPRFFIPSEVIASSDPGLDFLERGGEIVFAEAAHPISRDAVVRLVEYRPASTTVDVHTSEPGFIASSEVALPGWRLTRNGDPWPWVRINEVFIGWEAPPGSSRFRLRYEPRGFSLGWTLFALAAAALLALFISGRHAVAGSSHVRPR